MEKDQNITGGLVSTICWAQVLVRRFRPLLEKGRLSFDSFYDVDGEDDIKIEMFFPKGSTDLSEMFQTTKRELNT